MPNQTFHISMRCPICHAIMEFGQSTYITRKEVMIMAYCPNDCPGTKTNIFVYPSEQPIQASEVPFVCAACSLKYGLITEAEQGKASFTKVCPMCNKMKSCHNVVGYKPLLEVKNAQDK